MAGLKVVVPQRTIGLSFNSLPKVNYKGNSQVNDDLSSKHQLSARKRAIGTPKFSVKYR